MIRLPSKKKHETNIIIYRNTTLASTLWRPRYVDRTTNPRDTIGVRRCNNRFLVLRKFCSVPVDNYAHLIHISNCPALGNSKMNR
jgi:hypothetical protein